MRNPLIKRVPRELVRDWHKYLVIIVFMVCMIGVVSAMYIGHDSMMAAIGSSEAAGNLEDGRFETDEELSEKALTAIETGEMADVRTYFLEKGYDKADEEIEKSIADVPAMLQETEEFKASLEEARSKAYAEVEEKVEEEWGLVEDRYELYDPVEPVPVEVIPHYFRNESEDRDCDGYGESTIRVYLSDSTVDLAGFHEGRAPVNADEIAIDRMHAANVGLSVGDQIRIGGQYFTIVGLLSYVNFTTLHENNTDLMFDAFGFDVGMVTPEGFDRLRSRLHYNYVFLYKDQPADEVEEADLAKRFLKTLITQLAVEEVSLEDYVPEYLNQSSHFAPSDIEGDTAGAEVLIYILIAVIAFIFGITVSTTIDREASVIGTLRASGYTRGELMRHYMTMPVVVTLIGAALGNLGGYTVFKDIVVDLYYNSYSLPKYTTVWSPTAFVKTTLIPLILMLIINFAVIARKLRLTPLQFLRHDLKKTRRSKAVRLPRFRFLARFRLRIMLQNLPNYLILIFGICFIEIMLCFAFGFPDSLDHYAETAPDMLFAPYQYMLTGMEDEDGNVLETSTEGAERFISKTLVQSRLTDGEAMRGAGSDGESVIVYGYVPESRYIGITGEFGDDASVYISSAYADKYGLKQGDVITLSEKYEHVTYYFNVAGIFDYDGGIAAFMPIAAFNRQFDNEADAFSGYFSETEITDIDEEYIANVMTAEDVVKITTQLKHSMGEFMQIFQYALLVMSVALIYLLSKIIIEKNENAISMVKILGFRNREISSLYMLPTAIVVVLAASLSFFVGHAVIEIAFTAFLMSMDGWFTFWMSPQGIAGSVAFILIGYGVVSIADFRRIKRIPLDEALKNVE